MDAPTYDETATGKRWARASIANSLLLLPTAALQFNVVFWVLVVTNFALMHAIWVVPVVRRRAARDFRPFLSALIAFALLGNGALLMWGDRLLAVFPS